jgi:hypothetical protein
MTEKRSKISESETPVPHFRETLIHVDDPRMGGRGAFAELLEETKLVRRENMCGITREFDVVGNFCPQMLGRVAVVFRSVAEALLPAVRRCKSTGTWREDPKISVGDVVPPAVECPVVLRASMSDGTLECTMSSAGSRAPLCGFISIHVIVLIEFSKKF